MSTPYTAILSSNGPVNTPNSFVIGPSVVIPAGDFAVVAVPLPGVGFLTSVQVVQTGGTNVAFTVDALFSKLPYAPGDYTIGTSPNVPVALYRIIETINGVLGVGADYRSVYGQAYRNVDSEISKPDRHIYLIITPTSAGGSTTFDATITMFNPKPV